jgi:hypothetical protein
MKPVLQHLRIAFSATWVIACVLLTISWTRSYRTFDYLCFPLIGDSSFGVDIEVGDISVIVHRTYRMAWSTGNNPSPCLDEDCSFSVNAPTWGFHFNLRPEDISLAMPHWFLILLSMSFSALPWIRWRFNLRTLLIATTLVAVVLGLIVYATR